MFSHQSDSCAASQCRSSLWRGAKTWQKRERSFKHRGGGTQLMGVLITFIDSVVTV